MKAQKELIEGIYDENVRRVERALAAGAAVEGIPGVNITPLILAASCGHLGIVNLLLKQGANLETSPPRDSRDNDGALVVTRGTRALHAAANAGNVDVLRALLQAGAQPNAKNCRGWTPLMAACNLRPSAAQFCLVMVEVLLDAGAVPTLENNLGRAALHFAAQTGADDAIEVLVAAAPGKLNHVNEEGITPLSAAAIEGHESSVRLLLSLGASDRGACMDNNWQSSLELAAQLGHEGVAAVLLDLGLEEVGGAEVVCAAMVRAIKHGHPRILDMLLGIDGEEMRARWANVATSAGYPVLMFAAVGCCLTATSVLLAGGADERVYFNNGVLSTSEIAFSVFGKDDRDEAKEAAIVRMLERGPAFRARSCCWPVQASSVLGIATTALAPTGEEVTPNVPLGVRIFRPNNHSFFTSRMVRYAQKRLGKT